MEDEPTHTRAGRVARMFGVLALAAFCALLVYGLVARSPDRTIDDALARQEAALAPGFALQVLLSGTPGSLAPAWQKAAADGIVDLEELRGTPIVLNFWASWCPPCRDEAPALQRGWREARQKGVLFVGLDTQDAREDASDFIKQFGQDFPHVRDGTRDSARAWGTTGLPETFFISRSGEGVSHAIGAVDDEVLSAGVAAALSGRLAGATRGGSQRPLR